MCSGVPERQRGGRDPSRQDVCRLFIEWGGSTEGDGGHTYEEDKAFTERRGCMAGRIYSRNCDGATSPRGKQLAVGCAGAAPCSRNHVVLAEGANSRGEAAQEIKVEPEKLLPPRPLSFKLQLLLVFGVLLAFSTRKQLLHRELLATLHVMVIAQAPFALGVTLQPIEQACSNRLLMLNRPVLRRLVQLSPTHAARHASLPLPTLGMTAAKDKLQLIAL
mmetsp:Transcript_20633/g.69024  ORF Transcript_20633/g.69024 Transcript_20633/m.69024 type:complete len:219 (-) Transcript_20633:1072-1728(-)